MLSVLRCASLRQKFPTCMKSVLIHSARSMTVQIRKPRARIIDILKIRDNIPNNFDLIYKTSADRFLMAADYISTTMLVLIVGLSIHAGFLLEDVEYPLVDNHTELIIVNQKYQLVMPIATALCALTVAKVFCYKFTKRIYFDGNSTYKAVFNGVLPFQTRHLTISQGSVKKAKPSEIFVWKQHQFLVNNHKIYLTQNDFVTSSDLYHFCPEAEYSA